MDFTLTEEQRLLSETASALFSREFPSTLLRNAVYDPTPEGAAAAAKVFDAHLRDWFTLGDEAVVDQCLFLEEAGRALLTGPLWSTSALALPVLRAAQGTGAGPAAEIASVADALAAGSLTATVAMAGPDGTWWPNPTPTKSFVPDAGSVDLIVVVDPPGAVGRSAGGTVRVLGPDSVRMAEVAGLDRSRALFEVTPAGDGPSATVGGEALSGALERATVTLAAELVGVARWLRESTISYVCEREQFGRPVGSFQGLQWKLVDAALVQERAAAAVGYAAMCLDAEDPDRHRAVHVAKAAAGAAARRWASDGLQAHGGIGYTWEHDLHLRLRRAHAADHLLGDADWHRDRLAELIFDRTTSEEPRTTHGDMT